jgi:hypothetical protein
MESNPVEIGVGTSVAKKSVTVQSKKKKTPPSPTFLLDSHLKRYRKNARKFHFDLINDAIVALAEPKGSSCQSIQKHISSQKKGIRHHVHSIKAIKKLNKALSTGVANRKLVQVKGCYKLATALSKNVAANNPAGKPATARGSLALANGVSGFALSNFISPAVVQYLGVRSLVRFGAACISHQLAIGREVNRRKLAIAGFGTKVKQLMGEQPESVPTRANVIEAKKLTATALRLIDDELDFHHKLGTKELRIGDECDECEDFDSSWKEHDLFLEERKKFLPDCFADCASLYLLPDCFYFPVISAYGREFYSRNPSEAMIKKALIKAGRLWESDATEEHAIFFYEGATCTSRTLGNSDNWDSADIREFHLRGADMLTKNLVRNMEDTAHELAGTFTTLPDAFRIAARKIFFRAPASRDCLWYTLKRADEIAFLDWQLKRRFY